MKTRENTLELNKAWPNFRNFIKCNTKLKNTVELDKTWQSVYKFKLTKHKVM